MNGNMKKAELEAMIADLDEKAGWQEAEISDVFHQVETSLKPRNIAMNAAVGLVSKIRSIFSFKKKERQNPRR